MKKRASILSVALMACLSIATQTYAQTLVQTNVFPRKQAMMAKTTPILPANVAKANIQKVTSNIRWHTNLNSALAQAQREKKMVLWIHMIGSVDGST